MKKKPRRTDKTRSYDPLTDQHFAVVEAKDLPKLRKASDRKKHELALLGQIKQYGLPLPAVEYRFHPKRMWRFDFAWPEVWLAVEVEGGIWTGGRHTTGAGFQADTIKYNIAVEMGWRVFRYTPKQIKDGDAVAQLSRVLRNVEHPQQLYLLPNGGQESQPGGPDGTRTADGSHGSGEGGGEG